MNDICSICLENLENNEIIVTSCDHVYHTKCIIDLFDYMYLSNNLNRLCPNCRKNIKDEIPTKIILHDRDHFLNDKMNILDFFQFISNQFNIYNEIYPDPDTALDNLMYSFYGLNNFDFPMEIYFKNLVFTKIRLYSLFSFKYWFSKKSYVYELTEILPYTDEKPNEYNKKIYSVLLDDDGITVID